MPGLESLLERKELKFVFVGGKGGVGKTTTSSAIAIQFSYDRKVLLLSTDPAHSLSDAFRLEFKGTPTVVPGIPNLSVMEVNPETSLQAEIQSWAELAKQSGYDELLANVKEFQEWLSGVPGIDEATALSNVIQYVESGEYDTIVFDTAPTGHTLKLLQLPGILQIGLNKLNSWQSKLWGYYSALKGLGSKKQIQSIQKTVAQRLTQYKAGIEKIGVMLKDQMRTNFVVVCISEHLSINESRRLLSELVRHEVSVSHVVVNQLVVNNLDTSEMAELEALLGRAQPTAGEQSGLLRRMRASIQLCNARRAIQQKYLKDLKACDEVTAPGLGVVEMPLLASEVTGAEALLGFSQLLVADGYRASATPEQLEGWIPNPTVIAAPEDEEEQAAATGAAEAEEASLSPEKKRPKVEEKAAAPDSPLGKGDKVIIQGLVGSARYNGYQGTVMGQNPNGRYAVRIPYKDSKKGTKDLALKRANLLLTSKAKAAPSAPAPAAEPAAPKPAASSTGAAGGLGGGMGGLFGAVMADPEVQEKLKNPKFAQALEEVKANPAAFFMYMNDPEIGPFISKMMGKMGMGGGFGGF